MRYASQDGIADAVQGGVAIEVTEDSEKIRALRLLCLRHTPANMDSFDESIVRSLFRTGVCRVEAGKITGKRKKFDEQGKEMKFGRME